MIDSSFPVSINGIRYDLDTAAEGDHYRKSRQPLRLQNGVVLQGEAQKFQLRTDLLEWSLTDWSGGEGLLKYDPEQPNRYHVSHNVDVLDEIGKLKLAPGYEHTKNSAGSNVADSMMLVTGIGKLWGASMNSNALYEWDPTLGTSGRWKAAVTNPDAGFAAAAWSATTPAGDSTNLWLHENGVSAIWQYDGTTFTEWSNSGPSGSQAIVELGDYIYTRFSPSLKVTEIAKSGTPIVAGTAILDQTVAGTDAWANFTALTVGDGRVYTHQVHGDLTVVHEITPTTAAGAGAPAEIARIKGFRAEGINHHMGVLFLFGQVGTSDSQDKDRVVLYIRGGEFGVIANIREEEDHSTFSNRFIISGDSAAFDKLYFVMPTGPGDATYEWTLFVLDVLSGNISGSTVFAFTNEQQVSSLVHWDGELFLSGGAGAATKETFRTVLGTYSTGTAYLDSAIQDFGIADNKVLLSMRLVCEPLPASCSIELQYQLDQDGTWTSAGTYSTTSGTGTTFTISTGSATKQFRNIQVRIILSGTSSATPVVTQVGTRATVAEGLNLWQLTLRIDDEARAQNRSHSAEHQLSNLKTAAELGTVVTFLDGYQDRRAGVFTSHSVVIDQLDLVMDRPGRGRATVVLREVG